MAITRQKKESILGKLAERIEEARLIVFVNFHGLSTSATRELRKIIKVSKAQYQVAKKTLIKKALSEKNISGNSPDLKGETGVIFGTDDNFSELVKKITKFIKEHKELVVLGGAIENKFLDAKNISGIASIPSREVLLAKLAYVLNSPMQRFVGALNGNLQKLVIVISQIKKN